jgi:hypothetical protein
VPDLGADVERDQGQPGWPQHPVDLLKAPVQLTGLQVDDRVQRGHRAELTVRGRQVEEVPVAEFGLGVVPAADGDHAGGQIDADRGDPPAGQPAGDVAGAAAQIRDRRARFRLFGEAAQQGPVERLVGQFVAESGRVILGDRVITAAGRVVAFHAGQLGRR